MTSRPDLWLDADRVEGDTLITLDAERIREAHEYRLLQGGGRPPETYGSPISLLSHRAFDVTALSLEAGDPEDSGALTVIRGCFTVLTVPLWTLCEDRHGRNREPWPTRIFNPPRQNLSFRFDYRHHPCSVRVYWRHRGETAR